MQDIEKTIPVEVEQMDINSDADIPGHTHLSNPDSDTENNTEKLESEIQEQKDKYLRLFAEFDNYKRRTAKERIELMQTAGKEMAVSLLEVADDMDRAEKQIASDDDINNVKEGVQLVFNKLRLVLQQKGIIAMNSVDTDFDVEKHEAVTEIPAGEEKTGKVVDELQKGYYMNDKLIRFAKVVVGK
ncbi:MAG: nucleotide exchange factor GrpE [Ferruginibacter sp.]|nr:nucleotide exchange factor GrpE [Ferruginibacter sp.]